MTAPPQSVIAPKGSGPQTSLRSAYTHSMVGTAVTAAMGVCSGVLAARFLGPEARGQLAMLMLLPSLTIRLGNLGLTQAVAHLTNPVRSQCTPIGRSSIVVALLLGITESCVTVPFIKSILPRLPTQQYSAVVILMMLVPVTYVTYVLLGVDLGQGRFLRYNLYQALPVVVYVPLLISVALLGKATAKTFAMANLCAWLAVIALRSPEATRLLLSGRLRFFEVRRLLASGLNLALPDLAGLALLRIDYPILVRTVSARELGYYAVALAVGAGQAAMASPVGQVCFHATNSAGDTNGSREMLTRQFRFLQVAFVTIAAGSMLAAPLLIRVAFGVQFLGSIATTYWLIAAMMLWSCSQVLDYGLRGLGRSKLAALSNVMGLVLVLAASPALITRFGIAGMGAAMCLGQAASLGIKVALLSSGNGLRAEDFWGFNRTTLTQIVETLRISLRARGVSARRLWPIS